MSGGRDYGKRGRGMVSMVRGMMLSRGMLLFRRLKV